MTRTKLSTQFRPCPLHPHSFILSAADFTTSAQRLATASLRHDGGWQIRNGSTADPRRTNGRRGELAADSGRTDEDVKTYDDKSR